MVSFIFVGKIFGSFPKRDINSRVIVQSIWNMLLLLLFHFGSPNLELECPMIYNEYTPRLKTLVYQIKTTSF